MNPDPQRPKSLLMPLSSLSLSSVRGPRLLSRSHYHHHLQFNAWQTTEDTRQFLFFLPSCCCALCFCGLAWLGLKSGWSHFLPFTSWFPSVSASPTLPFSLSLCVFSYYCYCCCCCCTPCNATLYAAVDAFRGFCVYAMLSLGIPNARGHRQSLSPPVPLFLPFSPSRLAHVYWHLLRWFSTTCCAYLPSWPQFPHPPSLSLYVPACLPCLVLRFKHGARSFPTNRSGQHLHLHFHLHLQLHLQLHCHLRLHFSHLSLHTVSERARVAFLCMISSLTGIDMASCPLPSHSPSSSALLYSCSRCWCFLFFLSQARQKLIAWH